jgi:hypothetical protein
VAAPKRYSVSKIFCLPLLIEPSQFIGIVNGHSEELQGVAANGAFHLSTR